MSTAVQNQNDFGLQQTPQIQGERVARLWKLNEQDELS